jgi:two-component system, LytTR family, sensor kinase
LYFARRAANEPSSIGDALLYGIATWGIWLLLAPLILAAARRWRFDPGERWHSLAAHLPVALIAHVAGTAISQVTATALFSTDGSEPLLNTEFLLRSLANSTRISASILTYAGIVGLDRARRVRDALRVRELQAARLEAQATRARLEALGARLQPHFLFNALQSVSALVDEDPTRARTMLAQLGDLLRDALSIDSSGEVPLREELALLDRYLVIERTRFADRLRIEISTDEQVAEISVPRFLLQPLVENALRHGLAPRPEGGSLHITATRQGDQLCMRVWNNGEPLRSDRVDGIGLATTRERLSARFGDRASLRLRAAADGGVEAIVELPL